MGREAERRQCMRRARGSCPSPAVYAQSEGELPSAGNAGSERQGAHLQISAGVGGLPPFLSWQSECEDGECPSEVEPPPSRRAESFVRFF